jgi:hypothetical protein
MDKHDDSLACPLRQRPSANAEPASRQVVADRGLPVVAVILAILGLAGTSGCALSPPTAPAVSTCAVPVPSTAPSAPPPATTPAVARAVARPTYVRPVVPPLPTDVLQPSAQGPVLSKAQRRVTVPTRAAESAKVKDDAKS